jgi:hypothetical protein
MSQVPTPLKDIRVAQNHDLASLQASARRDSAVMSFQAIALLHRQAKTSSFCNMNEEKR